ncbi:putative hydrolase of the HAD superfamily [bacterium A37T11]|nr:putative hydrolase of the HAD superfamily [bacterium A37T11]
MENQIKLSHIQVIAFDADDTLWANEPYFRETEDKFCVLMEDYLPQHSSMHELFKTEIQNLPLYGYGIKAFILSMIETILRVSNHTVHPLVISKAIAFGKEMMDKPIELLEGVEEVLETLKGSYRLVVATKGDLLDQERKLKKSGLSDYFHHIEIMSDKQVGDYQKLIKHLDCQPQNFLMLGNSLKSDVLPVLEMGGYAAHIPYHITWEHEQIDHQVSHENFLEIANIRDILSYLTLLNIS